MMYPKGTILTNPQNQHQSYTVGLRGRPPAWLSIAIVSSLGIIPQTIPKDLNKPMINSKKCWKWSGNEDFKADKECIVIADNKLDAIKILNSKFKYPVSFMEFNHMWKETTLPEDSMTDNIYILHNNIWSPK